MKDLPIRTLVAVGLLGLLAAVLFFGGWVQACVLGLFSALAVFEMRDVFRAREKAPFVLPQAILGASMFAVLYLFGPAWVVCEFFLAFVAVAIERILSRTRTNADLVSSLFILLYPLAPLLFLGLIGFDTAQGYSRLALILIFAGVVMADNTAYMLGSLIGKHKLCPSISPNKTVEGAVGGLVGGALGGVIAYYAQLLFKGAEPVPMLILAAICFLGGLLGQFGDLFASTFKRWAGVKDFGKIFPGHGGVIDRLDSALFAAPFVFFALMLLSCLGAIGAYPVF